MHPDSFLNIGLEPQVNLADHASKKPLLLTVEEPHLEEEHPQGRSLGPTGLSHLEEEHPQGPSLGPTGLPPRSYPLGQGVLF